jgi:hypothetical protein
MVVMVFVWPGVKGGAVDLADRYEPTNQGFV